ncbi:NADH:flavin oxidoreductase/NADH oxidase family protein [Arthrobacter sp. NPDC090010]|uniref:NADH:flavin oxidoreductase/NADH oxidase family protein n=1 Tax=Arthrobacter sp. NPDC090010 TaxID=3363942 RepID=UPI0037FFF2F4
MTSPLFEPLPLAHGAPLPNRLAKAAMEEQLACDGQLPGPRMFQLYESWSRGGVGLILTGNVMVDARALTSAGGIVLDAETPLEPFRRWADAAHSGGARLWMQINHPGRQVPAELPGVKLAPSAVGLDLGAQSKRFATPEAMTSGQIEEAIEAFVTTARRAVEAGFDGVQIHAAHGYLLSQFLSPLSNQRDDEWGGDLEGRSRALREVVRRTRAALPDDVAVAVKLNSADFQRGGFDVDDAAQVVRMLGHLGVDLVELSGGSYESPAMQGRARDGRTLQREAYFLGFAEQIAAVAPMPLMLTGGVTRKETAEKVLAAGVDVVGIGTALSLVPDLPARWQDASPEATPSLRLGTFKDKAIASAARQAQVRYQLRRLAKGRNPRPAASPLSILLKDQLLNRANRRRYSAWLARRG